MQVALHNVLVWICWDLQRLNDSHAGVFLGLKMVIFFSVLLGCPSMKMWWWLSQKRWLLAETFHRYTMRQGSNISTVSHMRFMDSLTINDYLTCTDRAVYNPATIPTIKRSLKQVPYICYGGKQFARHGRTWSINVPDAGVLSAWSGTWTYTRIGHYCARWQRHLSAPSCWLYLHCTLGSLSAGRHHAIDLSIRNLYHGLRHTAHVYTPSFV